MRQIRLALLGLFALLFSSVAAAQGASGTGDLQTGLVTLSWNSFGITPEITGTTVYFKVGDGDWQATEVDADGTMQFTVSVPGATVQFNVDWFTAQQTFSNGLEEVVWNGGP